MALQAIKFNDNRLFILDQLRLPHESVYLEISSTEDAHNAIRTMSVRGAPAIAIVGMLGIAVDLFNHRNEPDLTKFASEKLDFIVTSRPTAVNLSNAAQSMRKHVLPLDGDLVANFGKAAQQMLDDDIRDNRAIGRAGVEWSATNVGTNKFSVITICNTGSLATAGFGTALGIVRALHENQRLQQVFCLETRPYNQGARLTAFELVHDKIPATLITDSMAASLMKLKTQNVKMAVVGADRVAANGDVANKIGTYQLAVLCRFHQIKFVVAAPTTSIDMNTKSGNDIVIEERPKEELTHINGQRIAADGINVWNPSFDVTPYELIDAIVTENGVFVPEK